MKVTCFVHACIWLMISFSLGCSKQNEALVQKPTGGIQEISSVYPHPVTWINQHMEIMSSDRKPIEASCLQCHKAMTGTPLKVSCTISCHVEGKNLPPKKIPAPVQNKCSECHSDVTATKYAHYPVNAGLCTTCHTVTDGHLKGEGDKVITKKTDTDCYTCHTRQDKGSVLHGALADSESCITCHNPHGGNQRAFIKEANVKALCMNCHDVAVDTKVKHGPAVNESSCVNCHSPHSSNNKKLLTLPSKQLCLSCHDKTIPATLSDKRTIPNIKEKLEKRAVHSGAQDDCTSCHNPHGTENSRILNENYSVSAYNAYPGTGKNPYALCFNCHDSNMLNKDEQSTNFRDGNKNQHWFHVVDAGGKADKSKGKSCKICHDPHGSNQDFSISETWQLNGKPVKTVYAKTKNGGTCTSNCHGVNPQGYERE